MMVPDETERATAKNMGESNSIRDDTIERSLAVKMRRRCTPWIMAAPRSDNNTDHLQSTTDSRRRGDCKGDPHIVAVTSTGR
jgi:hypothetical protein